MTLGRNVLFYNIIKLSIKFVDSFSNNLKKKSQRNTCNLGSQSILMLLDSQTSMCSAALYKYILTAGKRILTYNPIQNR